MSNVIHLNSRFESSWDHYIECQERAKQTGSIEDGIEAGRAWRRWLNLFMSEDQKETLDKCVVIGGKR